MSELLVPVSIGELVDKITILRIKQRRIDDSVKRANVTRELEALIAVCDRVGIDLAAATVQELEETNEKLWVIEDDIREKERQRTFDQEFIELARAVYITNDQRFALKSKLNAAYGSSLREEKSYKDYR